MVDLFQPALISEDWLRILARDLGNALANRLVNVKLTQFDGKVIVWEEMQLHPLENNYKSGGIRVTDRRERSFPTNSSQITLMLNGQRDPKAAVIHLETSDDPIIEWLSERCCHIKIRVQHSRTDWEFIILSANNWEIG